MFTGLIEEVGVVQRLQAGAVRRFEITAPVVVDDLAVGDSVNVNGACQTAVWVGDGAFAVESVAETLRRTTLGRLAPGDRVNLERSLRPGDRMGGHLVTGHVDGVGTVRRLDGAAGQTELEVQPPSDLVRYIAAKGSIAVDGISLTVARVAAAGSAFTVALIPHTLAHTNLQQAHPGAAVNLEVDLIARYVERLQTAGAATPPLRLDDLRDMGY